MLRTVLVVLVMFSGCASAPPRLPQPDEHLPVDAQGGQPAAVPTTLPVDPPVPGEAGEVTEVCAKVPCRWVEAVGQRMPYAYEGDVIVAVGESFAFTGTERDGLLVDLRPLPSPDASGPRVTVSWKIRPDGHQVFSVENGFGRRLRFRAMRLTPETTEFEDADSCAVAKLQVDASATWRSPVKLVALTGLEFVAEDTFDACEKDPINTTE